MFCKKCGNELKEGAKYCPRCGAKIVINTGSDIDKKMSVNEDRKQNKDNKKVFLVIGCIAVVMLGIVVIGYKQLNHNEESETPEINNQVYSTETKREETISQESETTEVFQTESETVEAFQTESETEIAEEESEATEKYILSDSDSRYLTDSDVRNLTAHELMLARNEIYARHGRKFKDSEIQAYFNSQSWYKGTVEPDDFSTDVFNKYEKENLEFIQEYENR